MFGAGDPASATDRVVVVAETQLRDLPQRTALRGRIAELSIALLGVPADDIVLADSRTLLKTSSGKIRRAACRTQYEQGQLGAAGRPVASQLARLWFDALVRRAREPLRRSAAALYAGLLWAMFGLGATAVTAAALLPARAARKHAARLIARLILRASTLPVNIEGAEHLAIRRAVVVANHASYVDWLLLTAILPAGMSFVAKRELAQSRPLLLLQAVQGGESLVFFPERTLTRAPGLRGFHMGAFVTAAQAGVAPLPVTLRGTRSVLRDGSWWPRRHPVQVHVDVPLQAATKSWHGALQLRDTARAQIAANCGEPVL